MAYALSLPPSVTELVYSLRDWCFEKVRKANGTPTALAIKVAVKDLITMAAHDQQYADAIEMVKKSSMNYPHFTRAVYVWPAFGGMTRWKKIQNHTLQQQREHILMQLYLDALE